MKKVAFINGQIFNSVSEEFVSATVLCEDGFITDVTRESVPNDFEIVDLCGKYLIPGLVDVHTHGTGGFDFNFAKENEIPRMALSYARGGTTSVMATLASDTMPRFFNSIFAINQNRLHTKAGCANLIGIHLEGRYLNPDARGAHALKLLALPSVEEITSLITAMMPAPIHISVAPELPGADAFIKKAIELGATVGVAHTNATYEQSRHAVEIGARSFTHTFNAMTKVHHRMPGAAVCSLVSDDAYSEIIADGQHMHPAMVALAYRSKAKDKFVLITDSLAAAGSPDGTYTIAGTKVVVKNGVAINEEGVLAGSTLTMFKAVKNLMKFCGITLNEALKCATTNPANMVKADFIGRIAKCFRADFIVIDNVENPEIDTVYVGAQRVL